MIYSFKFNGVKKDFLFFDEDKGIRRSAFAPITRNLVTIPGRVGAILQSTDTQIRVIQQPIFFNGVSRKNLHKLEEEIARWLITDEAVELIFDDEPDRIYYALVDGSLDIENLLNVGEGEITFICPDSYKYGAKRPINFANDSATFTNEGTADTQGVLTATFTAPASEFKVQNQDGKYVRVIMNFIAGDELSIDFKTRKIVYNGTVNMPSLDLMSEFFDLIPGNNRLTMTPAAVANMEITFTERWL